MRLFGAPDPGVKVLGVLNLTQNRQRLGGGPQQQAGEGCGQDVVVLQRFIDSP